MKFISYSGIALLVLSNLVCVLSIHQPPTASVVGILGHTSGGKSTLNNGMDSDDDKATCVRKCLSNPLCLSYFAGIGEHGRNVCRLDVVPYSRPLSADPYVAFAVPLVAFTGVVAANVHPYQPRQLSNLFLSSKVEQADHLVLAGAHPASSLRTCHQACLTNSKCFTYEYIIFVSGRKSCRLFSQPIKREGPVVTNLRFSVEPHQVPPSFQSVLAHLPKGETGNVVSPGRHKCLRELRGHLIIAHVDVLRSLRVLATDEAHWTKPALESAQNVINKYNACLNSAAY